MGIQINGSTDTISAIDGSLTLEGGELRTVSGLNVTGVVTATSYIAGAGSTSAPSITPSGDSNTGIFFPSADTIAFGEGGVEAARIDSSGRFGIGTTSPAQNLEVSGNQPNLRINTTTTGYTGLEYSTNGTTDGGIYYNGTDDRMEFYTADTTGDPQTVIDSSGRLLVGTSSGTGNALCVVQGLAGNTAEQGILALRRNSAISDNTVVGVIEFADSSDRQGAFIRTAADGGNWSAGSSHPSRLEFATTASSATTPTERARITATGYTKFSNTGGYNNDDGPYYEFNTNLTDNALIVNRINTASYVGTAHITGCYRSNNSGYHFLRYNSGDDSTNPFSDIEFLLRGDGNAYCDGSWNGGGADYAEFFEWSDNNSDEEDRRGISVVLDGDKIREAVAGEDPIGVISGNPSVVGDAAQTKWSGKYLRDDFGSYIREDYEIEDENGGTIADRRRKLNPEYDPEIEYIPREDRPEWGCVGLMGKLRIRKGQVTGARWIKMRDISDSVEEWLVR